MKGDYKVLIGASESGDIIFAETRVRDGEFSASFDSVTPINISDFDLVNYCADYYDRYSMGSDAYCDLLERFDCAPSELPEILAESLPVDEILDLSLYPEQFDVNGSTWVFESSGCGQCDFSYCIKKYVDEDAANIIFNTWKEFHLKPIPNEALEKFNGAISKLQGTDEEKWICTYIEEEC